MSVSQRRAMIGPDTDLRVSQQCRLLGLSRSTYYYQPAPVTADDLVLLRQMDEQYLKTPHYGARSYATWFQRRGVAVGRKKAARLMAVLGIGSTAPQPKTSAPGRSHPVYPYLLKGMTIERPDQVWAADITYVPLAHGFAYLVVIIVNRKLKCPLFRILKCPLVDKEMAVSIILCISPYLATAPVSLQAPVPTTLPCASPSTGNSPP